jgi:hypothetical protein
MGAKKSLQGENESKRHRYPGIYHGFLDPPKPNPIKAVIDTNLMG